MKKLIPFIILIIAVVFIIIFVGKKPAEETRSWHEEPGTLAGAIDVETSSITYAASGVGKQHIGTFPIVPESVVQVDDTGALVGGTLILDMVNLTGEGNMLTGHLKSPDFFNVEHYPIASYEITSTEATPLAPDTDVIINGNLTIKDQTQVHNVAATYDPATGLLQFSTVIDRTKWGIDFRSSKLGEFGDDLIKDNVQIDAVIDID